MMTRNLKKKILKLKLKWWRRDDLAGDGDKKVDDSEVTDKDSKQMTEKPSPKVDDKSPAESSPVNDKASSEASPKNNESLPVVPKEETQPKSNSSDDKPQTKSIEEDGNIQEGFSNEEN
ncbi:hypothetical protein QCA50_014019 [Cerrena zonata]|uniref:Uncharacterized protein n=1 Tax=Cerrena zonata TaxID=2478898 RepID=A0AAW0FQF0_9APHY